MMKYLITLLVLFLFTGNINAQNYTVQNFTDENGLPQNSVKSIAIDNVGYIWLATENGLVRYDGQQFTLFDKSITNAQSNRIINIIKDKKSFKLCSI